MVRDQGAPCCRQCVVADVYAGVPTAVGVSIDLAPNDDGAAAAQGVCVISPQACSGAAGAGADQRRRPQSAGAGNSDSGDAEFAYEGKQLEAIELARRGKNLFITGVAGTGKSVVTKQIIKDARARGKEREWLYI